MEKTLILVKHDGVQRGLVGEVVKRFENKGLRIVAMKMVQPNKEIAEKQYRMTPQWIEKLGNNTRKAAEKKGIKMEESNEEIAKRVRDWLVGYLCEGPVVAMIFEGYHAIEIGRKIVGHAEARQAQIGTIRGDFTVDSYELADREKRPIRNIVHASGNKEEAETETKLWFKDDESFNYDLHRWNIMH
ncbi:MAG: Nucleoside diphosphate kinase [Candidatus Woesearchaeota archaeon]|nr:Nucleoside diphosphate kinase [Candidatus Woesearchaeota archaeon]